MNVWAKRTFYDLPATAEYPADREDREAREKRAKTDMANYQEMRRRAEKTAKRVRKGEL